MNAQAADAYIESINRDTHMAVIRQNAQSANVIRIITAEELLGALRKFESDGENHD